MNMNNIANEFATKNRAKGTLKRVTNYSFDFETNVDKNGKSVTTTYMESYFLNLEQ